MIRQPNNYTCGPIVLYNLQKWANISSFTYRQIYNMTQCNETEGTATQNLHHTLKHIVLNSGINLIGTTNCTQDILQYLKTQEIAIILEYLKNDGYLHFILIIKDHNGKVLIINEGAENKQIPIIQYTKITTTRYRKNGIQYPIAWIIEKKKNLLDGLQ